jgi:hypothetical protein
MYKDKKVRDVKRKEHYQKNKDKVKKQTAEYHAEHPDLYRRASRKSMYYLTSGRREQVYSLLNPICVTCGFSDRRALQIDHINGNGKSDRKRYTSQSLYLKHILEVKGEGYQILCANCNWIKRHENKESLQRMETYD